MDWNSDCEPDLTTHRQCWTSLMLVTWMGANPRSRFQIKCQSYETDESHHKSICNRTRLPELSQADTLTCQLWTHHFICSAPQSRYPLVSWHINVWFLCLCWTRSVVVNESCSCDSISRPVHHLYWYVNCFWLLGSVVLSLRSLHHQPNLYIQQITHKDLTVSSLRASTYCCKCQCWLSVIDAVWIIQLLSGWILITDLVAYLLLMWPNLYTRNIRLVFYWAHSCWMKLPILIILQLYFFQRCPLAHLPMSCFFFLWRYR